MKISEIIIIVNAREIHSSKIYYTNNNVYISQ